MVQTPIIILLTATLFFLGQSAPEEEQVHLEVANYDYRIHKWYSGISPEI